MTVVDPFLHSIPQKILTDRDLRPFFEYLVRWANDIWERTGGSTDDISTLTEGQQQNTTNISILTVSVDSLETDVSSLQTTTATNSSDIDTLEQNQVVLGKRAVSTNTTASSQEILYVTNGATISLPAVPDGNSEVYVINADGSLITVSGNGNNIKVSSSKSSVSWKQNGMSVRFNWFSPSNVWVPV